MNAGKGEGDLDKLRLEVLCKLTAWRGTHSRTRQEHFDSLLGRGTPTYTLR
jgi:hypothetical protein